MLNQVDRHKGADNCMDAGELPFVERSQNRSLKKFLYERILTHIQIRICRNLFTMLS